MQELQEDLDAEKESRNKAEKLKRDLNEVDLGPFNATNKKVCKGFTN
jgi:hypothetical protein